MYKREKECVYMDLYMYALLFKYVYVSVYIYTYKDVLVWI